MSLDTLEISGQSFGVDRLRDGSLCIAESISGAELSADELAATIDGAEDIPTVLRPKGSLGCITKDGLLLGVRPLHRVLVRDLTVFRYGEPVRYLRDGVLLDKLYMASVKRKGKYLFAITCTSPVGLLERSEHCGDVYDGTPLGEVLADIVGGAFPYTLDAGLEDIQVYGLLPFDTRRNNLRRLLFAEGITARKDADKNVRFAALTTDGALRIPDERIFLGGDATSDGAVTAVEISEHAYLAYPQDKVVTLYDGESFGDLITTPKGAVVRGTLVKFTGGPVHNLVVENGVILESGVNYAILGPGSGVKLTGQEYTHTIRVLTASADASDTVTANVKRIEDSTLVSFANSENVAARMLSYYGATKTVTMDVIVDGERPGDAAEFINPYDEPDKGFLARMDITMSDVLRASATIISGFVPAPPGNYYRRRITITEDIIFTVPPDCRGKMLLVLSGGGPGGSSGHRGDTGAGAWDVLTMGRGGKGGEAGTPGTGGNLYIITATAKPGDTFAVRIGHGGKGGVMISGVVGEGQPGGDTTFGSYTSGDGRPSETGYIDLFTSSVYAMPGEAGTAGADGSGSNGIGPDIEHEGETYYAGQSGLDKSAGTALGQGGGGGGAALGASGEHGLDGDAYRQPNDTYFGEGGDGGKGAKPVPRTSATVLGAGGAAGHGGGGGGAGGGARGSASGYASGGDGGVGGDGGDGGDGADGGVFIYV